MPIHAYCLCHHMLGVKDTVSKPILIRNLMIASGLKILTCENYIVLDFGQVKKRSHDPLKLYHGLSLTPNWVYENQEFPLVELLSIVCTKILNMTTPLCYSNRTAQ